MGLFNRRSQRNESGAAASARQSRRETKEAFKEFVSSRRGVEAYLEPATAVTEPTLLLIAADGEWTRRKVGSAKLAIQLAKDLAIPLYDANRVGYPDRMRQYNQRKAEEQKVQTQPTMPPGLSPSALAALMVLESAAGVEPLGREPAPAALQRVLRLARAKAHPDRQGGDRTQWDKVESAANTLGIN